MLNGRNPKDKTVVLTKYDHVITVWDELFNNFIFPLYNKTFSSGLNKLYNQFYKEKQRKQEYESQFNASSSWYRELLSSVIKNARQIPHSDFATLGIEPTRNLEDIKAAFRSQSKTCHPDIKGGSKKLMIALIESRQICEDYANS